MRQMFFIRLAMATVWFGTSNLPSLPAAPPAPKEATAVKEELKGLQSPDPRIREAAAEALGGLGAGLDKAILHRVAKATIRALLRNVADCLASPSAAAARQAEPASGSAPWPCIEPEMP